jgi:hypothetical protein
MEPLEYYFETINRNAIIVKPRQAFWDWLNSVYPDEEKIEEVDENNIYLIKEMNSNEDIRKWIKRNFDRIFINELNDWVSEEEYWPKNRTQKLFTEWFDIEVHSMVLDIEESPVLKD